MVCKREVTRERRNEGDENVCRSCKYDVASCAVVPQDAA